MKNGHWTDEDFQRRLDEGKTEAAQMAHLRRCGSCRRQLRLYRTLGDLLSHPPPLTLPPRFAADTAAKIMRAKPGRGLFPGEWLWVPAILLFMLAAWSFLYQAPMLETVRQWFSQTFDGFQPVINAWSKGGRYLPWAAEGSGALLLAALLDRLVASFRARRLRA